MSIRFVKYTALGNDYLVLEGVAQPQPKSIERICNRRSGLGADGVLIPRNIDGVFGVHIFNSDGSLAEMSGNGLRIFARYLWDQSAGSDAEFEIATETRISRCQVLDDGAAVSVDMGHVRFNSAAIPMTGPPRDVLREQLQVDGRTLEISAANIGNPHCVLIQDSISPEETQRLGPILEEHRSFPNRVNVQFVRVIDHENLQIEIWERGSGYTLSSGSSSCAAAAVAHRLGHCGPSINIHMPGGRLRVEIDPDERVRLSGPVSRIASGILSPEFVT